MGLLLFFTEMLLSIIMDDNSSHWGPSLLVLTTAVWLTLPVKGSVWWPCNHECARCLRHTTPLEELLMQFYPGLFSTVSPVHKYSINNMPTLRNFGNEAIFSRSAQIHLSDQDRRNHLISTSNGEEDHSFGGSDSFKEQENIRVSGDSRNQNNNNRSNDSIFRNRASQSPRRFNDFIPNQPPKSSVIWNGHTRIVSVRQNNLKGSLPQRCCETIQEYVTPNNVTTEDGKVHRVVHLRHAFQFIPIAKCRPGTTCSHGECVDRYRAHWVLVYNATKTHNQPPVSFTPVEVPSYCACLNVGRP